MVRGFAKCKNELQRVATSHPAYYSAKNGNQGDNDVKNKNSEVLVSTVEMSGYVAGDPKDVKKV